MALFSLHKGHYSSVLEKYFSLQNESTSLEPLIELMKEIRRESFSNVLNFLVANPNIAKNLGYYIKNIFRDKPFNLSLTEANILSENAFFPEFKKRLLDSILPPVSDEKSVWYLINQVSVRPSLDYKYFKAIPPKELDTLFQILGISDYIILPKVKRNILYAMNVLAWRVIGNAMDVEVIRMVPQYQNLENPFIALQDELDQLISEFKKDENFHLHSKDVLYKQIKIYIEQCQNFVDTAFKNSSVYGISGRTNQSLLKIRQQLNRMQDILGLLVIDQPEDIIKNSKKLFLNILEYKSHKNNLKELADDSTRLLSHLITNHTAETGSHYITSDKKAYMKMWWKASGGGVVVGFLCILKMLYSYVPGSEFTHAFLYSFNYAMGFIMIYLMHYTLATKQPAMTAATMAKALSQDNKNTERNYLAFASVVSKLFRTQFIAFIGNVVWAFPVTLGIIYGIDVLLNQNFPAEKADKFLKELNPFESKALLHASLAGFYLFISGIIAGNVANNSVFYQMPKRIAKNPMINRIFGKKFAQKSSEFYAKNWAGIMSNFWFGILLGATAPIGKFLGLDLDIRHITFSAGNFALGLYGKDFNVEANIFWLCLTTIFLIGFFNFIVSFGLSIALALRSRKVYFSEFIKISKVIFIFFIKNPLRFFIPIKSNLDSSAVDLLDQTIHKK